MHNRQKVFVRAVPREKAGLLRRDSGYPAQPVLLQVSEADHIYDDTCTYMKTYIPEHRNRQTDRQTDKETQTQEAKL